MRTTYPNESFNSHIWRRAPKHLPLWKPTVDIVVEMAVLEFNKGSSGFISAGYKTGARYSQNASVKGSGRVPKSVHSPVISSTKKRSDIGVACTTIYL